ncbi:hypothetical protein CIY_34090 [Butyrivibrio fibrisolvens 16/4]|nr:hypothetical protein CIY_34090 [Butyrivibrio fibrisolvens 16/4]
MNEGLLPIGSVVLLKDSTKKIMIIGWGQRGGSNPDKIWDYTAVLFPEGYLDADKLFLFDNDQIERIYMLGFQNEEQMEFKIKAEQVLMEARKS